MTQLNIGDTVRRRELNNIHGNTVRIPDTERLVHLQFRRYAGCPACNVHLWSIGRRHDEILAAGIREVVVFHSKRETMLEFQGELPFAAIADPDKKLYAEFGVGKMSPLSAFDPRVASGLPRIDAIAQFAWSDGHRRGAHGLAGRLPDRPPCPHPPPQTRSDRP